MKPRRRIIDQFWTIFLLLTVGCSTFAPQPTATATNTPLPPTATKRPTSTPRPTATPNVAATQQYEAFYSMLQDFAEKGYVATTDGETQTFKPFKEEWAQRNWYQWWPETTVDSDFVFSGHFKWATAGSTSEDSGCGIIFGIQENDDHYAVFLDKSRILFLMARGTYAYNVGKTRGSGRVTYTPPAEADFVVAVKGQTAYVSVDGDVTEYTLSKDQTTRGDFGLTLLSGTNKDYGTRCEITDMILWTAK